MNCEKYESEEREDEERRFSSIVQMDYKYTRMTFHVRESG